MARTYRIGIQSVYNDAFWVQVGVIIEQQARQSGLDLIPVDIDGYELLEGDYLSIVEDLLSQELDAFIIQDMPEPLIKLVIKHSIPVILLNEQLGCHNHTCRHQRWVGPLGMANIARIITEHIVEQLHGRGTVLVIGGMAGHGEDGRNRLAGIKTVLAAHTEIVMIHITTVWEAEAAYTQILQAMKRLSAPPDAIFGLSDSLALTARAAAIELGLLGENTGVFGINGDPKAVAAITEGEMIATVETSTLDFGTQVINLALKAATGQPLPEHFNYLPRLITPQNITEVAAQKLKAIADLPNLLVGFNRRREQQRMVQLETSLAINRQIGAILDRQELNRLLVNLIHSNYSYDRIQLYRWSEVENALLPDELTAAHSQPVQISLESGSVLGRVYERGELEFVPDMQNSQRFSSELGWPGLRSRVVIPLRLGKTILGVMDLHSDSIIHHTNEQLMGLQLLADQLAVVIHNAELYNEALAARKSAEKADKLKTQLLANVSHEFRTPLNIILGYTEAILKGPNYLTDPLPRQLLTDLGHVYTSGEHLARLVNDLLDLSRAEIGELEIFPEIIEVRPVLEEVFRSVAGIASDNGDLSWQLLVPDRLPLVQADPMRFRQILLNLLSNARKFTEQGEITLGADVQTPNLHIWVKDTGSGIPAGQQALIFEPFVVGENSAPHLGGIGLGLSIVQNLVKLHRGSIQVESQPGQGSTFHLSLPLPNLTGQLVAQPPTSQQRLVYISNRVKLPAEVEALSRQGNLYFYRLRPAEVTSRLAGLHPSILAWDMTGAAPDDWAALDFLRSNPALGQLPFMLFGDSPGENEAATLTNILPKPLRGQTLQLVLETLRQNESQGDILIVDDDASANTLYRQLVQTALPGYTIHQAGDGSEALGLLQQLVPSLVIVDLMMPQVDGFEVIDWLRANPATRQVPVLVVSGQVLSAENIRRLDHSRVIFNSKDTLNNEEALNILQQVSQGTNLLSQFNSTVVKQTVSYLQHNYTNSLSLKEVAQEVGVSKNYLVEIFGKETGISPWEYLNRYRINQARCLLQTTNMTVTSVCYEVGFEDPAYFSRVFRIQTGQSPKSYRVESRNSSPAIADEAGSQSGD